MARFDPKFGITVAAPGAAGKRRLFVHVGSCDGCSVFRLDPAKTSTPAGAIVTVVFSGTECSVPKHLAMLPPGWRTNCDREGELQSDLNLYLAPRWFEADAPGDLVWLGKTADDLPEGVRVEG